MVLTYNLNGCYAIMPISVNPLPVISGPASVCALASIGLTSSSTGGAWLSSNTALATVSSSGIVTGNSIGAITISYIQSGCPASLYNMTVNSNPVGISGGRIACPGTTLTLSDVSSGGIWSSNNLSIATVGSSTGIVTGVTTGNTPISYILPTGCNAIVVVSVNPIPATISGSHVVCTGNSILLSDISMGGTWISSNTTIASVGTTGIVNGVSGGTATISYQVNGCSATSIITVNTTPGYINGASSICAGQSSTYMDTTIGGIWSTSNTAVATIGSLSGVLIGLSGGGSVLISYMGVNGCITSSTISVGALPATISGGNTVCSSSTITWSDATVGGTWSSLNPTIATVGSTSGIITPISAGTAVIKYTYGYCPVSKNIIVNGGCREGNASTSIGIVNEYTLYPNPTNGILNIAQSLIADGEVKIKLINYTGATVYAGNINFSGGVAQLQLNDIIPGVYLLGIIDNNGSVTTFRVVVDK